MRNSDIAFFDQIRSEEYHPLDVQEHVYLDYTGGHLYPQSLITWHNNWMATNVLGNPHSGLPRGQHPAWGAHFKVHLQN